MALATKTPHPGDMSGRLQAHSLDTWRDAELLVQAVRRRICGLAEIHPGNQRGGHEHRIGIALRRYPDQVAEHDAHQQQEAERLEE